MKNKILTFLLFIITMVGLTLTLIQLYAPASDAPLVTEGSYYYLVTTVLLFILAMFMEKEVTMTIKTINTIILALFAFYALIFSLIGLYASPTNHPEPYASAIFFLAGTLGMAIIPFIKTKKETSPADIKSIHKVFRIFILISLLMFLGNFALKMIASGLKLLSTG